MKVADKQRVSAHPMLSDVAVPAPWQRAREHLEESTATYCHVTVRDGAFHDGAFHDAEGAPTAGPPPYDVYEVIPTTAFGFGTDESFSPTRWRF